MPHMSTALTTFTPPASLGVEVTGSTCILTLDRPRVMNALDMELRRGLGAALLAYQADPALRVAILTGAGGRAFSSGDDLEEMAAQAAGTVTATASAGEPDRLHAGPGARTGGVVGRPGDGHAGSELGSPVPATGPVGLGDARVGSGHGVGVASGGRRATALDAAERGGDDHDGAGQPAFEVGRLGQVPGFDELRTCRKPVIAAIDGWCLAGGFELAMYSDIRLATRASRFGLPEPRRGLLPGPGLHDLPRMVPLGEALRLLLSGGHMSAERAYDIGLLQALADDRDDLFARAHAIAGEIALCAPLSVEAIKQIVHTGRDLPIERAWQVGEPHAQRLAASADAHEGVRAFAEKRPPLWQGR